jgi:type IX secretion system PorP/SprF family membrane protein
MKKSLPILLLITIVTTSTLLRVNAQNAPVFSQYLQNPFQFNPSYAAQQGHTEANLFYRKQWVGIENAPESAALNIQTPMGRNVSLGFTVVSNKTIILNTNSALATFAYRVRFGYYHHLNFGLAGGVHLNNFDLEAVANANDPALNNVAQKSYAVAGQFGFNYQYKNFNLGFALPNLFDSKANSEEQFQKVDFNPFLNKFGSLSYNFNIGEVQLAPTVIYRANDKQQTQWEGMVLATYKNFIWLGASYRQDYGVTGLIGLRLKGRVKVGFAYEYPTSALGNASTGTQEFYLGARLGNRDREEEYVIEKKQKDSLAQVAAAQKQIQTETQTQKAPETVEPAAIKPIVVAPVIIAQEPAITQEEVKPAVEVIPEEKKEEPAEYYVVLAAYQNQQNAIQQLKALRNKSLFPDVLYIAEKNYYYVYLYKSDNKQDALDELSRERQKNRFQGVWLYKAPIKK